MTKLIPSDLEVTFTDANGDEQTRRIDLVEANLVFQQFCDQFEDNQDVYRAYQKWLGEHGVEVTFGQTFQIARLVVDSFSEFKKKLPGLQTSATDSSSTPSI